MNEYEARLERRRERLLNIAAKLESEGNARYQQARQMAAAIPFGQPILVGHYSEGRDRNYRNKIHNNFGKAFSAMNEAKEYARRAASVGTGGISSDDPEAAEKLKLEVEQLEARQARMKQINAAHKKYLKNPESLAKSGLDEKGQLTVTNYNPAYGWEPHPYPPYSLSNNNANIRRIKGRIAQLQNRAVAVEKAEAAGETERVIECTTFKIVINIPLNRVQVKFAGKPEVTIRTKLKSNGFRWSPTEGAWQKMLNRYYIEQPTEYLRAKFEEVFA